MSEDKKNRSKIVDNIININATININGNENLGVSQKYIRKAYDNSYKRKKAKEEFFGNRSSKKDYITGETVHRTDKAAINKYGKKNYTKHTVDTDHINPLERIHGKLRKNPFLNDSDVKEIANDSSNLRVTQRKLNREKQELGNIDLIKKNRGKFDSEKKKKLVSDQINSSTKIYSNAAKKTVINVSNEFYDGATTAVKDLCVPLMVEAVNNLIQVASDEKKLSEVTEDMAIITTKVAVSGGGYKVTTTGLTNILKNSGNEMLKKVGESNHVGKIVVAAAIVANSTYRYLNGDINGKEFFTEIGEKGVGVIGGTIGYIAGQALIPIPVIGGIIGSMIVSFVCEDIYKTFMTLNDYKEREEEVKNIAKSAKIELGRQRLVLSERINKELNGIDILKDSGFKMIYDGLMNENYSLLDNGLKALAEIINEDLAFQNIEDFDEFFMDEDLEFAF